MTTEAPQPAPALAETVKDSDEQTSRQMSRDYTLDLPGMSEEEAALRVVELSQRVAAVLRESGQPYGVVVSAAAVALGVAIGPSNEELRRVIPAVSWLICATSHGAGPLPCGEPPVSAPAAED